LTRVTTLDRRLWILVALMVASAVLIAIGGSEASANPVGKTYTATLAPSEVTAGTDMLYTLRVTNTSDSTPLGAVNLEVPIEFELTTAPVVIAAPNGSSSWTASVTGRTIELRAVTSADRLDSDGYVEATFGAIGLQEFIGSEIHVDYAFSIDARQANSFAGEPGNGLTYIGTNSAGPIVRVFGVAKHCIKDDCDLAQSLGDAATGSFTLSGTCALDDCGIIAIDLVSDGGNLSTGQVEYTPAAYSTDVRAYLTLSKDVLTQAPSKYEFDLYNEDGTLKQANLDKCQRGDTNCIEAIERTKIDVTWVFRVDPVDPRMDWK
jgi:hypothetical protein